MKSRRMFGVALWLIGMVVPAFVVAASQGPFTGQIVQFWTYAQFGLGDVVFTISTPSATCPHGYWVKMSDPGAKTIVAQLVAAYHAQKAVTVYAHDDQMWAGSSGQVCLVYSLSYVP
jgi:hypothetical protein